jgi:hypothetical protein
MPARTALTSSLAHVQTAFWSFAKSQTNHGQCAEGGKHHLVAVQTRGESHLHQAENVDTLELCVCLFMP